MTRYLRAFQRTVKVAMADEAVREDFTGLENAILRVAP